MHHGHRGAPHDAPLLTGRIPQTTSEISGLSFLTDGIKANPAGNTNNAGNYFMSSFSSPTSSGLKASLQVSSLKDANAVPRIGHVYITNVLDGRLAGYRFLLFPFEVWISPSPADATSNPSCHNIRDANGAATTAGCNIAGSANGETVSNPPMGYKCGGTYDDPSHGGDTFTVDCSGFTDYVSM